MKKPRARGQTVPFHRRVSLQEQGPGMEKRQKPRHGRWMCVEGMGSVKGEANWCQATCNSHRRGASEAELEALERTVG